MTQFRLFLAFTLFYGISALPASIDTLTAYVEFLLLEFHSPQAVRNYLTGALTLHIITGFSVSAFHSSLFRDTLKAVDATVRHFPVQKAPCFVQELKKLVQVAEVFGKVAIVMRPLLILTFFTFLRLSSILPSMQGGFDCTRHLCWSDVLILSDKMVILVKWTKTTQAAAQHFTLDLAINQDSLICPVQALSLLLRVHPKAYRNQPLFLLPRTGVMGFQDIPLSQGVARLWLSRFCEVAGLPKHRFSFHSLRRGGSSTAFQLGVPISDIQRHGSWRSDAVFSYVQARHASQRVALALSSLPP